MAERSCDELASAKAKLRAAQRAAARAAVASEEADEEKDAAAESLREIEQSDGCLWKGASAKSKALEAEAAAVEAERILAKACDAVKLAKLEYEAAAAAAAAEQQAAASSMFLDLHTARAEQAIRPTASLAHLWRPAPNTPNTAPYVPDVLERVP